VFEVKATNGDTFLGGEDFDAKIVEFLADEFKKQEGIDLRNDRLALQRLKEAAEKAKIELSSAQTTEVNLPFITADQNGPKHLVKAITRADLERLVESLIKRTIEPLKKALADAGLKSDAIDEVVMVGGMTRMPRVRAVVQEFFGKEPHTGVNRTKSSPWAPPSRPACFRATSRTCSCSTSRRCRSASRRLAASSPG
jgi:molecular chaperone DnaK